MTKINNVFTEIISYENLYLAYKEASICKRYRSNVAVFYNHLEENLIELQNELIWQTYLPKNPKQFYVYEPKQRLISAPDFRDRVVQHALVRVIEPFIDVHFISQSYACRKNRGLFNCLNQVQSYTRKIRGDVYFYSGDIHHYFPSVNHIVLKQTIRRFIADVKVLWLCDVIIDSQKTGIPIGNLTSQLFANMYLNELDQYVKMQLRIKQYVRYMDNFLIISADKKVLNIQKRIIETYITGKLNLVVNQKSYIGKGRIPFCGGIVYKNRIEIRKTVLKRARKRINKIKKTKDITKIKEACISFVGYAKHFSCIRSVKSIINGGICDSRRDTDKKR
jgi:RNA-directed DNA polymerase